VQQGVSLEVILADNGSEDETAAVAAQHGARLVPLGCNRGLALACNAGAEVTDAGLVFFVNNDMRLAPDCCVTLAETLAGDESLLAADARHREWEGDRLTHGLTRLRRAGALSALLPGVGVDSMGVAEAVRPIPWGCAGALMVRRDRFEALGGFDARFFLDWEDTDLCWRGWRRGWGTAFAPDALLEHRVAASSGGVDYTRPRAELRRMRPTINAVRTLSSHRNWGTWVAKTMEADRARRALALMAVRAARTWLRGNRALAALMLQARRETLASWSELRAEAAELDASSISSSAQLLGRFLGEGATA
jgi:GT2 family glycosyltransferase